MACAANQLAQESSQEDVQREAHELAEDLISYRIGKRSTPPTPTSATLRRLSDQLEGRHAVLLNDMCTQLNVTTVGTRSKFTEVADEVFRGGINWGRIVALFTFGGRLAQACRRNGVAHDAEQVSTWVGDYVAGLSDWIGSQGGWVGGQLRYFAI